MTDSNQDRSRQRLLEHALYEALGGDAQDAPDLASKVRAAWESEDRAPSDPDAPAPPAAQAPAPSAPTPSAQASSTPGPRWIPWAAAAAIALTGTSFWWGQDDPDTADIADAPEVARGPAASDAAADPTLVSSDSDPDASSPLTAELIARAETVAQQLDEISFEGMPAEFVREMIEKTYREGALAELRRTPRIWPSVQASVDGLLEPKRMPLYARRDLVQALALDPSEAAFKSLRSLWIEQPEAFSIEAVVAMAERGAFEFEREVDAWLGSFRPEAPGESLPGDALSGALYGALRGDERALPILKAMVKANLADDRALLASVGLARLGRRADWLDRVESDVATLRAQLDAGPLSSREQDEVARRIDALSYAMALYEGMRMERFEPTDEWDGVPRAGDPGHWLDVYGAARAVETRDRAALSAELEALVDR